MFLRTDVIYFFLPYFEVRAAHSRANLPLSRHCHVYSVKCVSCAEDINISGLFPLRLLNVPYFDYSIYISIVLTNRTHSPFPFSQKSLLIDSMSLIPMFRFAHVFSFIQKTINLLNHSPFFHIYNYIFSIFCLNYFDIDLLVKI